jgi:hypothetical protein
MSDFKWDEGLVREFIHPEEKESYDWVVKNIQGSLIQWHIDTCQVLIALYDAKYRNPQVPSRLWEILRERGHELGLEVPYGKPLPFNVSVHY